MVGGFHETVELCENIGMEIVGIIDSKLTGEYLGYPILGNDDDAGEIFLKFKDTPIVITPDNPDVREKLAGYYSKIGFNFASLISDKSIISKSAKIGIGVIIQDGVNVSAFSEVGDFGKINSFANVMHDVRMDKYVTVAPNAVILGNVKIGKGSYVGANSTVLPGIKIDHHTTIGAGAVVTKDTESYSTAVGVPARKK